MLDQLYAYHPVTGKLHSASPDYPGFEATMLRQGYRVERVPGRVAWERNMAKQRARFQRLRSSEDPAPAPPEPVEAPAAAEGLPALGDRILHPVAGEAEVTHVLTMPGGERVPVCVGRRGTSMVRPGEWEPVAPASALEKAPPTEVPPPPQLPPLPVPTPSGTVYYQPSLF